MTREYETGVTLGFLLGSLGRTEDPSAGQTPAEIETYYRNAKEGDPALIRYTYGSAAMLGFIPTTITGTNPKLGRVYTAEEAPFGGKAWYAKSGKNCYSPTGQARLVVPTPQLVECIEKTKREENERQRERMREYFPKMMEDE
jgi:hypothetical protein